MPLKNILSTLFLLASLIVCGQNGAKKISSTEFNQLTANNKIAVYDVRTAHEFSSGHIAKATNADWLDGSFNKSVSTLDPKKPIIVYCKSGGRSSKAAKALQEKGFTTVYELDGGYDKYIVETQKSPKK